MKQKIKIMKPEQEMSDQEIRSYMDFDGLLAKQKQVTGSKGILRWTIVLLLLIGGGVSVGWYIYNQPKPVETEAVLPPLEQSAETEQPVQHVPESNEETQTQSSAKANQQKENADVQVRTSNWEINQKEKNEMPPLQEPVYLQAEPVDGYSRLYEYFNRSLVYPAAALKDSVQGVSTVAFTINAEGKPENITVTQSLGVVFDQEAIRLIQQMPLWKPASLNGKPVPSKIALPLTFQIQKVNNPE